VPLIEGEDFYYEGPYLVFTGKFLRERGYCCESGCRHCPWGFRKDTRADVPREDAFGQDGDAEGEEEG
jgi:hypothetical protein